jgi:hypothetical protein
MFVPKQTMSGCQEFDSIPLEETDICGAKLNKNVEDLSRAEAERWLKCRGCRNLSGITVKELKCK